MASRLDWLRTCKLTQLETIARATGINSSGTKPILTSHLQDELSKSHINNLPTSTSVQGKQQQQQQHQQQPLRKDEYRIFSIDMGIRNLAYCQLVLPSTWLQPLPHHIRPLPPIPVTPTLLHWSRIHVSKPTDPQPLINTTEPLPRECFSPSTFAPRAHSFLATHILPHNPTHILIERQRFRSMGGSAVQEWTLRVNMFEAMLYAILQAYSADGKWAGEVAPVMPGKVVKYWLDDDETGVEVKEKEKGKRTTSTSSNEKSKARKMVLVRDMVQDGWGVQLQGQAKETGNLVIGKREDKKAKAKGKGLGKFDDLADCLLQGLAWMKWEENKRLVWEKGLDALKEFDRTIR
ncbi:MAG: hypothetical protein Q9186_007659 [Xanthomendoza sp. 1 TL-2023]